MAKASESMKCEKCGHEMIPVMWKCNNKDCDSYGDWIVDYEFAPELVEFIQETSNMIFEESYEKLKKIARNKSGEANEDEEE